MIENDQSFAYRQNAEEAMNQIHNRYLPRALGELAQRKAR